jgi:hypothetical protein
MCLPWDAMTCFYAARNGHIEMLQWARADGCPWDAEGRGHTEVLELGKNLAANSGFTLVIALPLP